jgi:predicted metal-dependent peptidase
MGYTLPKGVLLDDKFREQNAEQIYDQLPEDSSGYSTLDTHIEMSDSGGWDDMEDKVIAAYEMTKNSKSRGSVPAGLKRWIDKLRKSKVKWERIFHKYVGQALAKDDYSFVRPNRRFVPQDIYVPDLRNYIIGSVVIGVDTSGSIGRSCLEQFAAEIAKIGHLVDELTVITCDARVHEVVKIRKFENFLKKIRFSGGGGTDFVPVFEKVKEMKVRPELLVFLTDTYGRFPDKHPQYPVLWVITEESGRVPWGQSVHIPNDRGRDW